MALLPNELAEDPSVAASLCFLDPRFRFSAWLSTAWLLCVSRFARRLCLRITIPLGPHIATTRTDLSVISSCLRSQHGFVTGPCITGLSGRCRFVFSMTMMQSSHAYLSRTSLNRRFLPVDNEDIGDCF
jgi:hypothetical protein